MEATRKRRACEAFDGVDKKQAEWAALPVPLQHHLRAANVEGVLMHQRLHERAAQHMVTYLNVVFLRLHPTHTSTARAAQREDCNTLHSALEYTESWTKKAFSDS